MQLKLKLHKLMGEIRELRDWLKENKVPDTHVHREKKNLLKDKTKEVNEVMSQLWKSNT